MAKTTVSVLAEVHRHRIEGRPVRMTPTTTPNIAWRCSCGWWTFAKGPSKYYPPATDEQIRIAFLEHLNA